MAAVLACEGATRRAGWRSFVSRRSAARHWGVLPGSEPHSPTSAPIHVTVTTGGGRRSRPGIAVHRSDRLLKGETTLLRGIPVTSVARTILDLASVLERRTLERLIDNAQARSLTDEDRLLRMADEHRSERGAGALRATLRRHDAGTTITRSGLEELFLSLCRHHRLPQPVFNVELHGLIVDCLWEEERLVVELDGKGSHMTRRAFQADRDRDSLLASNGYIAVRFTFWDIDRRPETVAARIRAILDRRRE